MADADVVVEAVFEKLEIKQDVFCTLWTSRARTARSWPWKDVGHSGHADRGRHRARLSRSSAPISSSSCSCNFLMMKLCELVRGSYNTFGRGAGRRAAVRRRDRQDVRGRCNRDIAGFVSWTRLIAALVVEAVKLVESGVISLEDLDVPACRRLGSADT